MSQHVNRLTWLGAALMLAAAPAWGVNRCTDASGRVLFTDQACPAGMQGPRTPAVMPRPASSASATAPAQAPVPPPPPTRPPRSGPPAP